MSYLEVRQNGKLVERRYINADKAKRGFRIRIGSLGKVFVRLGESTTLGKYEIKVLEQPSPDGIPGVNEEGFPTVSQDPTIASGESPEAHSGDIYTQIEGYKILGRLGEGGMGTVWRAVQLSTKREVALKMLAKRRFTAKKAHARFEREVALAAKLTHPNIARIYDSGLHKGLYYYAMELIEGIQLDHYVWEQELDQEDTLKLMRKVCEAVECAHDLCIVHRDLKPSNILVTSDREPHILDFGLAKAFTQEDWNITISMDSEVTGTPAYMAPEQAAGRSQDIDERTDVYSLGIILYQLLTGHLPRDMSGSRYDVLKRIVEEPVHPPQEYNETIDQELSSILMTCVAHKSEDRYYSAGIISEDIGNYLNGQPLLNKSNSAVFGFGKHRRRYRATLIVCLFLAVSLTLALIAAYWISTKKGIVQEQSTADTIMSPKKEETEFNTVKQGSKSGQFAGEKIRGVIPANDVNNVDLITILSEASIQPDSEMQARMIITQLEQAIDNEDWLEAHQLYIKLKNDLSQTSIVTEASGKLASWYNTIQNRIALSSNQYMYEISSILEMIKEKIHRQEYLMGRLMLARLRHRYESAGLLEKNNDLIQSLNNQLDAVLGDLKFEDNSTYYLNRHVNKQDSVWRKAIDVSEHYLQNMNFKGIVLLRVFLEQGDTATDRILIAGLDDTCLIRRSSMMNDNPRFISNGEVCVLARDHGGLTEYPFSSRRRIAILSPRHYRSEMIIPCDESGITVFGDVILKYVPKFLRGSIRVNVIPEQGIHIYGEQVTLGLRIPPSMMEPGFYRGPYFFPTLFEQLNTQGTCIFDSLAPGDYSIHCENQRRGQFSSEQYKVTLRSGQTETVEVNVYKLREVMLDWRFFDPITSEWLSGSTIIRSGASWQPGDTWAGVRYPVISVSKWNGQGCTIRTSNGSLLPIESKETFEKMPFSDHWLPNIRRDEDEYKVESGHIYAWWRKDTRGQADGDRDHYLKALFKVKSISIVTENQPDRSQKSMTTVQDSQSISRDDTAEQRINRSNQPAEINANNMRTTDRTISPTVRRSRPKPIPPFSPTSSNIITNSIGMDLVWIPPGQYMMGSSLSEPIRETDETPQHRIQIRGFWMSRSEVTVGQFTTFINATQHQTEGEKQGWSNTLEGRTWQKKQGVSWRDPGFNQSDRSPVVCVSWNDAKAFCDWLNQKEGKIYRLPTEAEWEYACRAGSAETYCFGNNDSKLSEYAWYVSNSKRQTHPVCEKQANAFGLYDMYGNVYEWCEDWYASNYYARSPAVDPQGPSPDQYRNMRGGSWNDPPHYCRSADRKGLPPGYNGVSVGFRVLLRSD